MSEILYYIYMCNLCVTSDPRKLQRSLSKYVSGVRDKFKYQTSLESTHAFLHQRPYVRIPEHRFCSCMLHLVTRDFVLGRVPTPVPNRNIKGWGVPLVGHKNWLINWQHNRGMEFLVTLWKALDVFSITKHQSYAKLSDFLTLENDRQAIQTKSVFVQLK